jgi:nucleoside-triphosphatase
MQRILLLGKPKIGKTILVKKIIAGLKRTTYGGFFTAEIKEKGKRVGFKVISTDGEEAILAHMNCHSNYHVSKYFVNVQEFERVALTAIENAEKEKDLIAIDEIGKMELFSHKFVNKIEEIFNKSNKKILATIPVSKIPLIEKLKKLPDAEVIEITEENRDRLVNELIKKLD